MPRSIGRSTAGCTVRILDIEAGAFKRAFGIHRNAVTTAVKSTSRTSECGGRGREEMCEYEGAGRNVTDEEIR